jgi:hypothetical protein
MAFGGSALASINIDGTISAGEWAGASTFTIGTQGTGASVGTAYVKADQNYAYAAFDITGWTAAMGAASGGNLLGFGLEKGTGNYPAGNWIEFQQSTTAAAWGGGGPSGSIDGEVAAFRYNTVIQGSLPNDLLSATSFGTGHLVWEVEMPLALFGGLNVGDTLNLVGGINFNSTAHWYPAAFGAVPYSSFDQSNYGHIMVEAPVPEPTTMVAGALLLLPFGASALRMLRKSRTA